MNIKTYSFLLFIFLCTIPVYGMEKETAKKHVIHQMFSLTQQIKQDYNEKQHSNSSKNLTLTEPKTQPLAEQYDGTDTLSDDESVSSQYKRLMEYSIYSKDPKNKR